MKRKDKPLISVIMSAYNSGKYISEAIESILNQTLKDFEFIIINDASTDKTSEIIKRYARKDKRIIVIGSNKNIGLTKSLNIGLRKAKGKYIARMDADDISLLERLQVQYNLLEENKEIFLCGSSSLIIDNHGKVITKFQPKFTEPDKIKNALKNTNCITHPTIMFRNEKNKFYRDKFRYAQDYDFYLCLLTSKKSILNLSEHLLKYRISSGSISWAKKAKQKLFELKAREFYQQRLKYGKDEYASFNPHDILDIDLEKSTNKFVLESEIKVNFQINDVVKTRKFCIKYFNNYGFLNKILIYYVTTFLGKEIMDIAKRFLWDYNLDS